MNHGDFTDQRDILDEIDKILDDMIPETEFVPAIVAKDVLQNLEINHPELLARWLHLKAQHLLTEEIGWKTRSRRATARRRQGARAFAAAVDSGKPLDYTGIFDQMFVVDEQFTRRRLGDMTGHDHEYVANRYKTSKLTYAMQEQFHRAVAAKVGNSTTAEVFTVDEYASLYRELNGKTQ